MFPGRITNLEIPNWNLRWGGRRYPPYAFTGHGVAMLSSVLNGTRAVQMNILIIRAYVKLRELLATHKDLARKKLKQPPPSPPKRRIGFHTGQKGA